MEIVYTFVDDPWEDDVKNKLKPNLFVAKARVIFKKKGLKPRRYHFTPARRIYVTPTNAKFISRGYKACVYVNYIDGSHNDGDYETVEDLKWALKAFIIEYLNG